MDVAAPFWSEIDALARDLDVKVALELHPQNLVFNPADIRRLIELTGATNIGVELDASHPFWQQREDPVTVIRNLGPSCSTPPRRTCKSTRRSPRSTACWTTASGVLP